jgi:hypothetical protein
VSLTKKEPKKSRLYANPTILPKSTAAQNQTRPTSSVSNMVLLNPPPISQKRDLNKAGDNTRLAIFISKDAN